MYMKGHIFEQWRKIWRHRWSSQLYTQVKQLWNLSLTKIQAWTGFKPMTSAIPMQCSTDWAIKPTGSWSQMVKNANEYVKDHILELQRKIWNLNCSIPSIHANDWYERSYTWTVEKDMKTDDHQSYRHNLSSCEIKAWQKFRPERDLNPWPLQYQCSALPTELSSQLRADHVVSSLYTRRLWVRNPFRPEFFSGFNFTTA